MRTQSSPSPESDRPAAGSARLAGLPALLPWLAACALVAGCPGELGAPPCTGDDTCPTGSICEAGRCRPFAADALPIVRAFTASPGEVLAGASSTLSWEVTGAAQVRIDPLPGPVGASGSQVLLPTSTTRFVLTATNSAGSATSSAQVGVTPVIAAFDASPALLAPGGTSTLTFTVRGASTVLVEPGHLDVTGLASIQVSPVTSTRYTLTAIAGSRSAERELDLRVLPLIQLFVAEPPAILSGGTSTLSWSVLGADSLRIDPGAAVTGTSLVVSPAHTTSYSLVAGNAAGTSSLAATVEVDYRLSGQVSGLLGAGLVLRQAGLADLPVPSGATGFRFAGGLPDLTSYSVSVAVHPANPRQTCAVGHATGTIPAADVTGLTLSCQTLLHHVSGTVAGLSGTGLSVVLQPGGETIGLQPGATSFAFTTGVADGGAYAVALSGQPSNPQQTCTVSHATGTGLATDATNVAVACTTVPHSVTASIQGLAGPGLALLLAPGGETVYPPAGATSVRFATAVLSGADYAVSVTATPLGPQQACTVAHATGTVAAADIADVLVSCTTYHRLGGTIAGLVGEGLVLQSPGLPDLPVTAGALTFQFAAPVLAGSSWSAAVGASPVLAPAQSCSVTANATGTMGDADFAGIEVSCATQFLQVAGSVAGLTQPGLRLSCGDVVSSVIVSSSALPVPAGATYFTCPQRKSAGSSFAVSVGAQPQGLFCGVLSWGGDLGELDATYPEVICAPTAPTMAARGHGSARGSAIVKTDGTLWTWGGNGRGQLGRPGADQPAPVKVGNGYRAVSLGSEFSVALQQDGSLWTFGANDLGQLGVGAGADTSTPQRVGDGFTAIAAGARHALAIKADGTLWAWGDNGQGQLKLATSTPSAATPQFVASGIAQIAAGPTYSLAVTAGGTLLAFGDASGSALGLGNLANVPAAVSGTAVSAISAGESHFGLLRAGGDLLLAGRNDQGQLGTATTSSLAGVHQVPGSWRALSAGAGSTLAIDATASSTLWAFGSNGFGQLGLGTTSTQLGPARVGDGFVSAALGATHGLAVKADATMWGFGGDGQAGMAWAAAPQRIRSGIVAVWAGLDFSFALDDAGRLLSFGNGGAGQLGYPVDVALPVPRAVDLGPGVSASSAAGGGGFGLAIDGAGRAWSFGDNTGGALGTGVPGASQAPALVSLAVVATPAGFSAVSGGGRHALAVLADGRLLAWGANDFGQAAAGAAGSQPLPAVVGIGFRAVAAGASHSVAVKQDGTLWSWGNNTYGQLGNGTTTQGNSPAQLTAPGMPTNFVAAAAGTDHTVALTAEGDVYSFGGNYTGQLGIGSYANQDVPVGVASGTIAIAAGNFHTVLVKADGSLWAAGLSNFGQAGTGDLNSQLAPRLIGQGFVAAACGGYHTLGLRGDGTVWGTGTGYAGQLGRAPRELQPHQIDSGYVAVAAGEVHAMGLKADGSVWTWGDNYWGQLGNGSLLPQLAPVRVGVGFSKIVAGRTDSFAIRPDGTVAAWGANHTGQLGLGPGFGAQIALPKPALGGRRFAAIAAGDQHTVALAPDGKLWGTGNNSSGQLGLAGVSATDTASLIGGDFLAVGAGWFFTVGIRSDHTPVAFGDNSFWQLGTATSSPSSSEMLSLAGPIPQAKSISVAGMSAFAFQPDGAVLSWGVNGNGRLGLGPGLEFTVAPPRRLPQTGWTSISLADHALGLRDRSLFAWGRDDEGQIGNGSTGADVLTATPVAGRWISVAAGETFSVGVQEDGSLWSWGNRDGGQLGDGTGRALLPEALPIP